MQINPMTLGKPPEGYTQEQDLKMFEEIRDFCISKGYDPWHVLNFCCKFIASSINSKCKTEKEKEDAVNGVVLFLVECLEVIK